MTTAAGGNSTDGPELVEECRRELDVVRAAAGHLDMVIDRIEGQVASAHRLGIAVGIVMAQHRVSESEAVQLLRRTSHGRAESLCQVIDSVVAARSLAPVPDYI